MLHAFRRRSTSPAPRRALRAAATGAVALLALSACVAPKEQTTPESASSPSASAPADTVEAFYEQDVSWETCGAYECATVRAPLDWDDVGAGEISLAVQRSLATGSDDERIGSLLINPGGPGSSGIEFLDYAVTGVLGADVLAAYDVVGFDPRGVAASSAVDCGPDPVVDEFLTADVALESQADVDAAREAARAFGEGCLDATGALLGEVDTVSAAKDMDLLRAVLGDDELHYIGFSYGTFLGATYAELFPEKVGRLVLDGALDPAMSNDDLVVGQAIGFEDALGAYVEDCLAGSDCALSGTVDEGKQQIAALVERAERKPLDAGNGQTVNGALAFYGIVVTLYDDASWPLLTMALSEAMEQNTGATLLELANFYLDRTPDGTYLSNSMVAFTGINCLDYPVVDRSYDEMVAFADQVAAQAPTFGRHFAMAVGCETWPFQSEAERKEIAAAGAAPILVIGTTGDPATPYEWSVALAEQLDSGVLITWEGEGHTAYGRSNACVEDAVDAYLVDGTVPEDGLEC
ncbi:MULTISPECIES: alpha/beta hydrolase [unclassified Actinotalea]|uniref:alpha/beta hydrolase n=1 Tax=unclassified Actinotalea TaxID=2638618 RepID=UPI0015F5F1E2|nr:MULTISPECIES: alpha/beta hydrolase [unclassified Actinotalea]